MFSSIKWFSSPSFGSNWNFLILSRDWDSFRFVLLPRDKPWSTGCSADKQTSVRKMVWRTNWIFMFWSLVVFHSTCIRKQKHKAQKLSNASLQFICISVYNSLHMRLLHVHTFIWTICVWIHGTHIKQRQLVLWFLCFNQTQSENDPCCMKFMQKTRFFMWCRWIKTNSNLVAAFIKTWTTA